MADDRRELYRSDDLSVVFVAGADPSDILVITFDCFTFNRTLDRPGFGEAFFKSRAIDAVHVISRDNQWYQHVDMAEAIAAAACMAKHYQRVGCYGSSMGAYAALRFGARLGADVVIAVAPQYSLDRTIVPFDDRWLESLQITFQPDDAAPITPGPEVVIFYDPFEKADRQHVERIERDIPVTHVRVPYAGHSVGLYLSELGKMAESVIENLEGRFDAAETERLLRRDRRQVGQYFDNLSRLASRRRPALAVLLSRLAVARNGNSALFLHNLGERLAGVGLFAEAEDMQRRSLEREPNATPYIKVLIRLLLRRGAVEEANTWITRLSDLDPNGWENSILAAELAQARVVGGKDRPRRTLLDRWRSLISG